MPKKGNGNFSYIDNFQEAEKVLLKEFTKTLYAVADDVYMNVSFNPDYVKDYRLIGFDNRIGALKDSLSIIEGGEIGSGHSLVAVFEVIPTEINKGSIRDNFTTGKFADIKIQYRLPNDTLQQHAQFSSPFVFTPFNEVSRCYQFSAAVIMFGSLLKESPYTKDIGWNEILTLAESDSVKTDLLQTEFISIVQQAKALYTKVKKKKDTTAQK